MERGLAETRERAQWLILAGRVSVGGVQVGKPSALVPFDASLQVERDEESSYVSRGAFKLLAALQEWRLDVTEVVALDVGASTGGFVEVLLRYGAQRVYAVDVGYGQLHYRLRQDARVVAMERTNVRHLVELPEVPRLATVDVSFISLRLALPPVFALIAPDAVVVALVKPQFEAGRNQVGKGGVVRSPLIHESVLLGLAGWSADQPWRLAAALPSPVRGPAGNIEFLSLWRKGAAPLNEGAVRAVVEVGQRVP